MIKVALFGMDERSQNILTMFLSKNTQIPTIITPQGEQSVAIVDLDGVDANRLWLDLRRQFHGPAIVLSVREQTLRNAYCLSKPFNAQAFLAALAQVKKELTEPAAKPPTEAQAALAAGRIAAPTAAITAGSAPFEASHSAPNFAPEPSAATHQNKATTEQPVNPASPLTSMPPDLALSQTRALEAQAAKHLKTDQPSNAAHLISDEPDDEGRFQIPDEAYTDLSRRDELFFDVDKTLLGLCKLALKKTQATNSVVLIDGLIKPCYLYPDTKHILTEMRWSYLRSISMMDLTTTPIKLTPIPSESIAPITSNDPRIRAVEGILWSVAVWTSRGRVPTGTPLDQPVHLLHWPNLTRLSDAPGAMQISALWIKQPSSLLDTAVFLGLPYRHVFSFYLACQALGLVHIEITAPRAQGQTNAQTPKPQPMAPEKRGLFARMLNKLGIK